MRTVFDVVRIHPDKTTEIVQTVLNRADADPIVETPQFVGTWINSERKLLRYGRGEIRIVPRIESQQLGNRTIVIIDDNPAYFITVLNGGELQWMTISQKYIAGHPIDRHKELWRVASFTELTNYVDKNLAYQCALTYDTLVELKGLKAMM